jgi:hypothetical protein
MQSEKLFQASQLGPPQLISSSSSFAQFAAGSWNSAQELRQHGNHA